MRLKTCPGCGFDLHGYDGRLTNYYVRARLYSPRNPDEPADDSDGDKHPGAQGEAVFSGFPAIIESVQRFAYAYHKTSALRGLDTETMKRKLRGFRSTLSRGSQTRNKGQAAWRITYDTPETWTESPEHKPLWLLRVDIEKVDK